ncbi:MAG: ead/Ea22-like family protein [Citrobacter freundii]|nr:ead/Ea22-like family protein [Citrobacter freundii]
MTALNKQALRQAAEKAQEHGVFNMDIHSQTVLALLDELETKEEQRANWFQMAQKLGEDLDVAEKRIAELEARAFNPAILDVIAERQRQQSVEGWTPEHDDEHSDGEMALAASSYALYAHKKPIAPAIPYNWPWEPEWFKQQGARRDLVKAGALIMAEIERIDRAAGIGVKGEVR